MKKIVSAVLACAMLMCLAGCGAREMVRRGPYEGTAPVEEEQDVRPEEDFVQAGGASMDQRDVGWGMDEDREREEALASDAGSVFHMEQDVTVSLEGPDGKGFGFSGRLSWDGSAAHLDESVVTLASGAGIGRIWGIWEDRSSGELAFVAPKRDLDVSAVGYCTVLEPGGGTLSDLIHLYERAMDALDGLESGAIGVTGDSSRALFSRPEPGWLDPGTNHATALEIGRGDAGTRLVVRHGTPAGVVLTVEFDGGLVPGPVEARRFETSSGTQAYNAYDVDPRIGIAALEIMLLCPDTADVKAYRDEAGMDRLSVAWTMADFEGRLEMVYPGTEGSLEDAYASARLAVLGEEDPGKPDWYGMNEGWQREGNESVPALRGISMTDGDVAICAEARAAGGSSQDFMENRLDMMLRSVGRQIRIG